MGVPVERERPPLVLEAVDPGGDVGELGVDPREVAAGDLEVLRLDVELRPALAERPRPGGVPCEGLDVGDLAAEGLQLRRDVRPQLGHLLLEPIPPFADRPDLLAGAERRRAFPIGGGEGYAGNANAVASRGPVTNLDRLYPVTYGSSHIQAVAFTDRGVDADTILTYGQSMDPTRTTAADQTRLFSQERWVDFAFTPKQIRRALVSSYRVSGRA